MTAYFGQYNRFRPFGQRHLAIVVGFPLTDAHGRTDITALAVGDLRHLHLFFLVVLVGLVDFVAGVFLTGFLVPIPCISKNL